MTNKKSFTLIELIIFMGIFSILIFVLTDIFFSSLKVKSLSETSASVNQDGQFIFSKLVTDINNANTIISPTSGIPSSSLEIILYGVPETIRLNGNTKNIELSTEGNTYVLNSYNTQISNLAFTRLGDTIRINLTLQSQREVISLET